MARKETDGPVLFEGQIAGKASGEPDGSGSGAPFDAGDLGLPTSERAIVSYLTNSYGGVGKKTAESLVEAFGADVFAVFETEPGRVAEIVPRRAPQVLAEWRADFERRSGKARDEQEVISEPVVGTDPAAPSTTVYENADSDPGVVPPVSSVPSSDLAPRSGGARRRTRRGPRRPPTSGLDE